MARGMEEFIAKNEQVPGSDRLTTLRAPHDRKTAGPRNVIRRVPPERPAEDLD